LVPVSAMVQVRLKVGTAQKGSRKAVAGSGMASMSEASMDFQPRMEEPSKPRPSEKESSDSSAMGRVKCCQMPKVSTNLTSTILAPCLRARSSTLLGVLIVGQSLVALSRVAFCPDAAPTEVLEHLAGTAEAKRIGLSRGKPLRHVQRGPDRRSRLPRRPGGRRAPSRWRPGW